MIASGAPSLPPVIQIPTLWCPIPARVHPEVEGIEEHLVDWVRRFDLVRSRKAEHRFYECGFGQFAAEVYPRGPQLRLVAEWTAFNWILDDHLDEGHVGSGPEQRDLLVQELMAQMPVTPRQSRTPRVSSPVIAALGDLWRRTAAPMSYAWRSRFVTHYRDFLAFTILPFSRRDRGYETAMDLNAFVRRRRLFSGCEMSFDLIEAANLSEIPQAVADSDSYRAVRLAANDAISWTNDIFSVRKEMARGDEDHLVAVLRTAMGSSWQQAVSRAAGMVADMTRDFLVSCHDLRGMRPLYELSESDWLLVEDSLADLGEWISGSLHWHINSPRYQDVDATPEGQAPPYVEQHLY